MDILTSQLKRLSKAESISDVSLSKKIIIINEQRNGVQFDGDYKVLKALWKNEQLFYSQLHELIKVKRVYISYC